MQYFVYAVQDCTLGMRRYQYGHSSTTYQIKHNWCLHMPKGKLEKY